MQNQDNADNNQHQEKSFYQKHPNLVWKLIWIGLGLIILFFFFRSLEFKNPIFSNETKKEAAIIDAMKNNSDRIIDAIDENGDKIGEKVDKNTESNNAGFQKITDTLSAMKKECISCKEKPKPCPPIGAPSRRIF